LIGREQPDIAAKQYACRVLPEFVHLNCGQQGACPPAPTRHESRTRLQGRPLLQRSPAYAGAKHRFEDACEYPRWLSIVARTNRELIRAAPAETIHHVPVWAEGMMEAGVKRTAA
jgi:hypothetical protein